MRPKADDVPNHENASRNYLADEVQAQRRNITELVGAVAGLEAAVHELVQNAREERKSASEHRANIREQLYAQRMEQGQLSMSLTNVQTNMETIKKTLGEHETERQQAKGAFGLASASARSVWLIIVFLATSAAGFFVWVMKWAPNIPPLRPDGHP